MHSPRLLYLDWCVDSTPLLLGQLTGHTSLDWCVWTPHLFYWDCWQATPPLLGLTCVEAKPLLLVLLKAMPPLLCGGHASFTGTTDRPRPPLLGLTSTEATPPFIRSDLCIGLLGLTFTKATPPFSGTYLFIGHAFFTGPNVHRGYASSTRPCLAAV